MEQQIGLGLTLARGFLAPAGNFPFPSNYEKNTLAYQDAECWKFLYLNVPSWLYAVSPAALAAIGPNRYKALGI